MLYAGHRFRLRCGNQRSLRYVSHSLGIPGANVKVAAAWRHELQVLGLDANRDLIGYPTIYSLKIVR